VTARWRRPATGAVLATVVVAGLGYAAVAGWAPRPLPVGWPPESDLAEFTAAIHVHSAYSHDARGSLEEIAAAAERAGVDVVFLTDHNTLGALDDGREGWYGRTLVLVGVEVTTGDGYLLLLDPARDAPVKARGYALDDLVGRWRERGSLVYLAHPEHPRLGWRGEMPDIDGLEIVDIFDQVVGAPVPRQALGLLAYPANPVMAILSVVHWPRSVMERWDALTRARPTVGLLALDAHGGIELTEEATLWFPSHETAFRLGRLHFVTEEALGRDEADRTRVYRSMRKGRFYNALDGFARADGFRFELRLGPLRALMGDRVPLAEGLTAVVRVPPAGDAVVRLLADGEVVHEAPAGGLLEVPVRSPGAYRVEVDLRVNLFPIATRRHMPWIFSNPVYVTR
jgi:predicted metal-dependent phosphoesterase TrpH